MGSDDFYAVTADMLQAVQVCQRIQNVRHVHLEKAKHVHKKQIHPLVRGDGI
jgi:hypothetical protein